MLKRIKLAININMNKPVVEDAVFYITNVCNLACKDCESFNNYNFKGHFLWESHSELYTKWAELIECKSINIHGGEPFLNNDLINWAINLKKLWPNAQDYFISTNGTRLIHKKDIVKKCMQLGYNIDIVVHEPDQYNIILNNIKSILSDFDYYESFDGRIEFKRTDNNQLLASVEETYNFRPSAIKQFDKGVAQLQRSNPKKAFKLCIADNPPCVPFVRGYMYSCLLTSLITDFVTQFNVEQEAKTDMLKYRPCSPYDSIDKITKHINETYRQRDLCKYCPDSKKTHSLYPMPKTKPKIPQMDN